MFKILFANEYSLPKPLASDKPLTLTTIVELSMKEFSSKKR